MEIGKHFLFGMEKVVLTILFCVNFVIAQADEKIPSRGENCIGGFNELGFVINNNCSADTMCVAFDDGWFCVKIDEVYFINRHLQASTGRTVDEFCEKMLCQYGSSCEDEKCKCLKHFTGTYCGENFNYCTNHTCKEGATCLPRLGGYNCKCPPNSIGRHCEHFDLQDLNYFAVMENPDFLFEILQYASFEYTYVFFSKNLGLLPKVTIDFGNGRRAQQTRFMVLENATQVLTRLFRLPLYFKCDKFQVFTFNHTFENESLYEVEVNGWNGYYHIFNTTYQIRVVAVEICTLRIIVHNSVEPNDGGKFYRKTAIFFPTAVRSNCSKINFDSRWKLFRVNSNSTKKQFIVPKINDRVPNLYIPPYTMEYGNYMACISVRITKPVNTSKKTCTRFKILQEPLVPHIQDGTMVSRSAKKMFRLDASLSFDPNFPMNGQPALAYTWTCEPQNKFCLGSSPLNETGPILVVPSDALQKETYNFQVMVNHVSSSTENNYTGIAKQQIEITESADCFYFINCTKNCVGGVVNTKKPMVMTGVAECKSVIKDLNLEFCWYEYHTSKDEDGIPLNDSDFYREINEVIVYKNQLRLNTEYSFKFFSFNHSNYNSSVNIGKPCNVIIKTLESLPIGSCTVVPSHGIAMLTIFTINCVKLYSKDLLHVLYEVEQIVYINRPKQRGILYAYSLTELIANVTLGAGIQEHNYLTNLQVSLTHSNGITSSSIYQVTVYPLFYILADPVEVWSYVSLIINGKRSLLNVYLENGNEYEVIQQMISTATSVKDIYKNANFNETNFPIDLIQNFLIHYLIDVPTSNIYTIRFVISAMKAIVKMSVQKHPLWTPVNVNVISYMKIMLEKLKKYYDGAEEILGQQQIDIIWMDFLDITSNFLELPSPDFTIYREDLAESVSAMNRYSTVNDMNPYDINPDILSIYNSRLVIDFYFDMMEIYINTFKSTRMRPTIITSQGIAMIVQKHLPQYVSYKSLSVSKRVNIHLRFNSTVYQQTNSFEFKILVIDNHPDWYASKDKPSYSFPYVKVVVNSELKQPQIIPVDVDFYPIKKHLTNDTEFLHKGSLPIKLFWKYDNQDIKIHKIFLDAGGKLMVKFKPLQRKHKILVVLKKDSEPTMSDFWENGIIIPQAVMGKSWSIFVDDPIIDELTLYYLGVFMDTKTIKELTKDLERSILDEDFQYDDLTDAKVKREVDEKEIKKNETADQIDYEFSAYSLYCFTYKNREKRWTPKNCNVRFITSTQIVRCNCFTNDAITAHFKTAVVESKDASTNETELMFDDNLVIVFIAAFICFLFVGLFKWTIEQDRKDMLRRTVCFLVDNYPQCEYTYLLIVYSGRHVKAGTTSNITVELEGTLGTSLPHVLRDWSRPVLVRGSQDWFVIKTSEPLGEIYCLHMWADFSGEKPNWFCDKVIVHDIQCQKIWFFVIKQWFDPLMGDGSLSYTAYQASDEIIFSSSHYFEEVLYRELDAGMHGWLSIFYKYPYNNYTRTQRAGVAFTHLSIMMLTLIYSHGLPEPDVPQDQIYKSADYNLEWGDLYLGFIASLIAFPIHILLVCFFRSIKPSSRWIESRLDRTLSRFNMDSDGSYEIMWISSEMKSVSSRIRVKNCRSKDSDKKVTHSSMQTPSKIESVEFRSRVNLKSRRSRHSKLSNKLMRKNTEDISLKESSTDTESGSLNDNKPYNHPKHSKNKESVVTQSYFFQPFYSYIAWILLFTITMPSIYAVLLYGISYGWVMSLHYLTSLLFAIVISIFCLETLKWFFWSLYLFFTGRQVYAVEDRTDLVMALNSEFRIPESMRNRIVRKINKLRENSIYQQLLPTVLYKITKNRISSFMIRMMISKLMLLVLFALLQAVISTTVYTPNSYLHIQNLKNLVRRSNNSRTNLVRQIQSKNDFIQYIETLLIPNLQQDEPESNSSELISTVDNVNYLIGVIQLRQIRKDPIYCRIAETPHWKVSCPSMYDTQNYSVGWGSANKSSPTNKDEWFDVFIRPWQYENRPINLRNSIIYQNRTRYPHGAYEINLARLKNESLNIIKYLKKNYWFDDLTAVIYIDFVLYNPSIYSLAAISIMAERTDQGLYYVNHKFMYDIVHPVQTYGLMYLLIYLVIAFIWLMMFIYAQAQKYTIIRDKKYVSPKFGFRRTMFLLLALIAIVIHISKTVYMDYFNSIIKNAKAERYVSIGRLIFMGNCMTVTITLMLILIIVEFIYILSTSLKMKFVITVYRQAAQKVFFFFVLYIVVMAAFNWAYYMNFGTYCYHYRSILLGINNQFLTVAKHVDYEYYRTQYGSVILSTLFYFTYIISMVCIWQSFAAAIIISIYCTVKRNQRKDLRLRHTSVLNNYDRKYFDSFDGQSNRKQQRFDNFNRRMQPKFKIMGYLVVDWYYNKANKPRDSKNYRHEAMKIVLLEELKKMNYFFEESVIEKDDEQKTEYNMQQVMRAVVLRNVIKDHLNRLNKKVNILLRHNNV